MKPVLVPLTVDWWSLLVFILRKSGYFTWAGIITHSLVGFPHIPVSTLALHFGNAIRRVIVTYFQ